ncbi:MAG TPA: hypothetical protein VFX47_00950 [Gammaproteobacteria bacterium]|nr:hypothetical protein [Gammaproteobacteria bacterium]
MNTPLPRQPQRVGAVLTHGWHLGIAGLFTVFPYLLAAEIIGALPVAGAGGGIWNTDLARLAQPGYLGWTLFSACLQAFLYACAIQRLAKLDAVPVTVSLRSAARAIPALFIAYLVYQLLVLLGVGVALILLLLVAMLFGVLPGLVVSAIPLAPTAWVSTVLALFAYPAVLERCGPFVALGRSLRLAKSHWPHVALAVSAPAMVLLCVAVLQDALPVLDGLRSVMAGMSHLSTQPDVAQLQALLSNPHAGQASGRHPFWYAITVVLSALAWWYALVVCYTEYKALKQ